jgi:hypothetical protein
MATVEDLLASLLNARNEILREEMLEVLHARTFERSEALRALAVRVQSAEKKFDRL